MLSSLDSRNIVCFMDLLYGYILITLCQIFLDIRKVYGDVLLESAVLYVWRLVSIYFILQMCVSMQICHGLILLCDL